MIHSFKMFLIGVDLMEHSRNACWLATDIMTTDISKMCEHSGVKCL
jgi:hypothetical protein